MMDRTQIESRVRELLAQVLGVSYNGIGPDI